MKIRNLLAPLVAIVAAPVLFTTAAHADPVNVSVDCYTGQRDLTTAQVLGQATSPPPPGESSTNGPDYASYVRAFEKLPSGYTAQQYLQQMQEQCKPTPPTSSSSEPTGTDNPDSYTTLTTVSSQPLSPRHLLIVFDTQGYSDVVVSPSLGITKQMAPHIAVFKQAISQGDYAKAVDNLKNSATDELNYVKAAEERNRPLESQPMPELPCNEQELRTVYRTATTDFPVAFAKAITKGDVPAIITAILAAVGLVFMVIVAARHAFGSRKKSGNNDQTAEDDIVDAEVVEDDKQ